MRIRYRNPFTVINFWVVWLSTVNSVGEKGVLNTMSVRDITKLSGYPPSNVKTRLEQSNYYLASGRFPLQNAIYDNTLPFSRM